MTQPDLARLAGLAGLAGLVERLRTMASYPHKSYPTHFVNPDGPTAATEIEALLARIATLEEALDAVLASSGARGRYHAREYIDAVAKAEALLARAALTLKENDDVGV